MTQNCALLSDQKKQQDAKHCPGQYNIRFIPDKTQMLLGTKGSFTCTNTLCKHSAVIKSLKIIKLPDIKSLDQPIHCWNATQRSLTRLDLKKLRDF